MDKHTCLTETEHLQRRYEDLVRENNLLQDIVTLSGHEWRNHLARLHVSLAMLNATETGTLSLSQQQILSIMHASIAAMRHIACNFLMGIAMGQGASLSFHPQSVKLFDHIVQPLLLNSAELVRASAQTVEIGITPLDMKIWADPALLSIIFDNLLSNAIKYGEAGGRIRLTGFIESGLVVLGVWNSGKGLSQSQMGQLFQRFNRLNQRANQSGIGVGLSITRRLVETHGGVIEVESAPEAGVHFRIVIPEL